MPLLSREEYVEQAYLFSGLCNRLDASDPVQTVMRHLRDEILTTTKLPMAIDYLLAELGHVGLMSTAMARLAHYFTPFQTYLMAEAEDEQGRFDMRQALQILEVEARLHADAASPVATFLFQFETLCRNHLDYDHGLAAMSGDPVYPEPWSHWVRGIRRQVGMVGIADLIYVHSEYYVQQQQEGEQKYGSPPKMPEVVLFGVKEGRIALANRTKEPQYLFSALQRQLGYPAVPRPKPPNPVDSLLPKLVRQVERLETRIKLLEDENRESGIDLSQYYQGRNKPG